MAEENSMKKSHFTENKILAVLQIIITHPRQGAASIGHQS